jgi:hypothetical protein
MSSVLKCSPACLIFKHFLIIHTPELSVSTSSLTELRRKPPGFKLSILFFFSKHLSAISLSQIQGRHGSPTPQLFLMWNSSVMVLISPSSFQIYNIHYLLISLSLSSIFPSVGWTQPTKCFLVLKSLCPPSWFFAACSFISSPCYHQSHNLICHSYFPYTCSILIWNLSPQVNRNYSSMASSYLPNTKEHGTFSILSLPPFVAPT